MYFQYLLSKKKFFIFITFEKKIFSHFLLQKKCLQSFAQKKFSLKKICALAILFFASSFCFAEKAILADDSLRGSLAKNKFFDEAKKLPSSITFWSDYKNELLARALVERMTNEELFSQVFMFGWAGAEPEQLLYDWVSRGLGSVKVFGWNTDNIVNVARAISSLQKSAARNRFQIPLFVATDQEGGWIRHVKGATSITPGNMAIGASGYLSDAWYSAYYISREIHALGINMNFAPSLDLFTNHQSTIIGPRSFGDDAHEVGELASAFASGSIAAGVIPTGKHFPGHGDTENDSHVYLPEILIDEKEFAKRELVPFEKIIQEKIPAIMSGHLSFPNIDTTKAPASLSSYFLTELLRKKMGFDGLIITDDMMMNGDTVYAGNLSNAVRMAITAGNDIVISSTTAKLNETLWSANLLLMQSDENFYARVKDAAYRIVKAKLDYFKGENPAPLFPDATKIGEHIPDKDGQKFFLAQACRSITTRIFDEKKFPLTSETNQRILLAGSFPKFFSEGKRRYKNILELQFDAEPSASSTRAMQAQIKMMSENADVIICMVSSANTKKIAESAIATGKPVIVFSILSPAFSLDLKIASAILFGYSWSNYTIEALFACLSGDFSAQGELPFRE